MEQPGGPEYYDDDDEMELNGASSSRNTARKRARDEHDPPLRYDIVFEPPSNASAMDQPQIGDAGHNDHPMDEGQPADHGDGASEAAPSIPNRTTEAGIELSKVALGDNIHPVPPDGREGAVQSQWSCFDQEKQGIWRAVRHMAMNIPASMMIDRPDMLFQINSHEEDATNTRAISFAAILGLFGIMTSRKYFISGIGLVQEEEIIAKTPDPKECDAALKQLKYVKNYMFKHYFATSDMNNGDLPQYPPHDPPDGTDVTQYEAPCFTFFVETLYSQLENVPNGEDDRGSEIGIRVHLVVWNRKFSTADCVTRVMNENDQIHRQGRLTQCGLDSSNPSSARYAKQCRPMVANRNVRESNMSKFMNIRSNRAFYTSILAIAGFGSPGEVRPFYESDDALGDGSLTRPIRACRMNGSNHALSFEYLMNIRREDRLPMTAGMVGDDGVALKIHPKQADPDSYANSEYFLTFPFADGRSVFMLTDNEASILDVTLPNRIGSLSLGDAVLKAYWECNADTEAIRNAEDEVLDSSPSLTRQTLSVRHMKSRLSHALGMDLTRGDDGPSLMTRRLQSSAMVAEDSFDVSLQEKQSSQWTVGSDMLSDQQVTLQVEKVANKVDIVIRLIKRARALRLAQDGADTAQIQRDYTKANSECMVWAFEQFNHMYHDPDFKENVEPVTASIWKGFAKLCAKIPEMTTNIEINRNDPARRKGTANVAFAFDWRMKYAKLSPFGNWMRTLGRIYTEICGVWGRRLDIKMAIHHAAIAPSNPGTLREILIICGKRGMAKTMILKRYKYIFNRMFDSDPSQHIQWFHFVMGGSKCSKISGGIDFTSGGVSFCDEAVDYIANTDVNSKEQLQHIKTLTSDKRTAKARAETKPNTKNGSNSYGTVNHEFYSNTSMVYAHNLGPYSQHEKDGVPTVPDDDRRAFLDRTFGITVTESAGKRARTLEDQEFEQLVKDNEQLMTVHSVVVQLTYIIKHVISYVPHWRPTNGKEADAAWNSIDEWMNKHYDIPFPDDRRKTIRRDIALTMAIESAVVQVFLYKETAVSFDSMLPLTEPFDEHTPEDKRTHVLPPFSFAQCAEVLKILHYDVEIVVNAASYTLDRCIYTMPDVHHIMVAFAHRHGIGHCATGQTICSTDPNRPIGQGDVRPAASEPVAPVDARTAEQAPSAQIESVPASADASTAQQTPSAQIEQFGGFDPGPGGMEALIAVQRTADAPSGPADTDDDDDLNNLELDRLIADAEASAAHASAHPPPPSETAQVRKVSPNMTVEYIVPRRGLTVAFEQNIRKTLKAMQERRLAHQTFLCRSLGSGNSSAVRKAPVPSDYALIDVIRHIMCNGKKDIREVELVSGDAMPFDKFCDLLLPTSSDLLDGGYAREDLVRWVMGQPSQTNFTPQDGEHTFIGVSPRHLTSVVGNAGGTTSMWSFGQRKSESQFSPNLIDPAWRTARLAQDVSSAAVAPPGDDGSANADGADGAGGGGAARQKKMKRTSWVMMLYSESTELALHSLSWCNLQSLCIFDRLQSIIFADEKQKRMLQVSSQTNSNDWLNGRTLMRVMKDAFANKYAGVEPQQCVQMSDSVTVDGRQQIIPLHALGWKGALLDPKTAEFRQYRQRDPSTEFLGVAIEDMGQRRIDAMVADQALPAMSPMVSTTVILGSPLHIDKEQGRVYVNSPWLMKHIQLDVEMSNRMATIPGLRTPYGEENIMFQSAAIETSPSSSRDVVDLVDSGTEVVSRYSAAKGRRIPASVGVVARNMIAESRTVPEKADIDACIQAAKFVRHSGVELHDKPGIFYTFQIAELFRHSDDKFMSNTHRLYPQAFKSASDVCDSVPHLITRFCEATENLADTVIMSSGAQALLTVPKFSDDTANTDESVSVSGASDQKSSRKRAKKFYEFNDEEIDLARRKHYENTGEWITDQKKLAQMANKQTVKADINSISMQSRRSFINDLIKSKYEAGILATNKPVADDLESLRLFRILLESGTNISATLRRRVAMGEIDKTGDAFIDERARYLFPVPNAHVMDGTCEEIERMRMENAVAARLDAIRTAEAAAQERDDGALESDAMSASDDDDYYELPVVPHADD
jgi:hypothetical protein